MARRELQEINAGSMADIAFLLLIFFLVSTTMDTDFGIMRRLPPMPEEPEQQDDTQDVKERNVFVVLVNRNNQIQVEGELMDIQDLRAATRDFILNEGDDPTLPAREQIEVEFFGTMWATPKHVISLQNDRGTSYGTYILVHNELVAAYNELRDELAMRKWGVKYEDLSGEENKERRKAIDALYKPKISEAEPRNIGG